MSGIGFVGAIVGYVGTRVTVTPPTLAAECASGDVIFVPIELAAAVPSLAGLARLSDLRILSVRDVAFSAELWFFSESVSAGALGDPFTLSDADAAKVLRVVELNANNFKDCVNAQVADIRNIYAQVKAGTGSTSIWMAGVARAVVTFGGTDGLNIAAGLDWF